MNRDHPQEIVNVQTFGWIIPEYKSGARSGGARLRSNVGNLRGICQCPGIAALLFEEENWRN
jgi:hypothetical protein